ncbi:MAG: tetratricopeptide repeat protein [Candidatus Krumholzibacteriales bacterium]
MKTAISGYSLFRNTFLLASVLLLLRCAGPAQKEQIPAEPVTQPEPAAPEADDAEVSLVLANQAASNGNYTEAARILENQLGSTPENIEVLRLLAQVYAAAGRAGRSSQIWKRIYSLDRADPDAAYEVASGMAENENWQGVRESLREVQAAGEADQRHYLMLGEASLNLGFKSSAEEYLKKAGGLERAETLLGELYYGRRKYSRAEKTFRAVLEKDPDNYSANLHLGYINYRRKDYRPALRHYRRAVEAAPRSAHARLSLAALYRAMGKDDAAIETFRKGLNLPGVPRDEGRRAYNTLCLLLLKNGRYGETIRTAGKGAEKYPGSGGLYYYWGIALYKTGRLAEAKAKFKKASRDPLWKDEALKKFHAIR